MSPIFSTGKREQQRFADLARRQKIALDVRHRDAAPFLGVKAREIDAEPLVEPVFDELVHQHEVLGVEHDPGGIAMVEADLLR